jgi:hypothetical protein
LRTGTQDGLQIEVAGGEGRKEGFMKHETQRADGATVYGHTTPTRPTPSYLRNYHNDNKQTQLPAGRRVRPQSIPQTCHVSRTHPRGPAQATHIPGLKPQTESYVHQPKLPGTQRYRRLSKDSGTQCCGSTQAFPLPLDPAAGGTAAACGAAAAASLASFSAFSASSASRIMPDACF